jgi:EAL domain-containing protein (putative c-di-GMP-specific phosphodiesterase class I)
MAGPLNFGIITAAVLVVIYSTNIRWRRLPVTRSRYFYGFIITEMVTLAIDAMAGSASANFTSYSVGFLYFINTLYFVFSFFRSYMFLGYTFAALKIVSPRTEKRSYIFRGLYIIVSLIAISSFFTGALFTIDPQTGYHAGSLFWINRAWSYTIVITGIGGTIIKHKELSKYELFSMFMAYGMLVLGYTVRFLVPHTISMNQFFMLATLIMYIALENQSIYLEPRTETFLYSSFHHVIHDRLITNRKSWLCAIVIHNYLEMRQVYSGKTIDLAFSQIGDFLNKTFPKLTPFYAQSGKFVLLGPQNTNVNYVQSTIMERFAQPWNVMNTSVYFDVIYCETDPTLQFGKTDEAVESMHYLLQQAEKSNVLDHILLDDSMKNKIAREFSVRKALNKAIENNQIKVFFQPIISTATRKPIAAEALARIENEELGLIPPGEFIHIAIHDGTIIDLGDQILDKVCKFISENDLDRLGLQFINVNLSPLQCLNRNLPDNFRKIINNWNVSPNKIRLEITEEALIEEAVLKKQMTDLINVGFSFVLDDYGSGYANQFQLREFPFKGLKLDARIVWAHFNKPDKLLPNMVATMSKLGVLITAEGVETKEMSDALCEMGCNYLQGYYYSKPVPADKFLDYIRKTNNTDQS